MNSRNRYEALAAVYDRLADGVDYPALARYLLCLFGRYGTPPATVLDAMCGTGGIGIELAKGGVEVIGVDISENMLAAARQKAQEAGVTLLLLQQDLRNLDLYGTVGGAVCTLDGMNHLLTKADLLAAMRRLALFIEPSGLFLFDVNTPYKHREVLGDRHFILEDDGVVCAWRNRFYPRRREVGITLDIFEEEPDGRYHRATDEMRERAYSLPTYERLLETAGFQTVGVFAAYTLEPPSADCERWMIAARRNAPSAVVTEDRL